MPSYFVSIFFQLPLPIAYSSSHRTTPVKGSARATRHNNSSNDGLDEEQHKNEASGPYPASARIEIRCQTGIHNRCRFCRQAQSPLVCHRTGAAAADGSRRQKKKNNEKNRRRRPTTSKRHIEYFVALICCRSLKRFAATDQRRSPR